MKNKIKYFLCEYAEAIAIGIGLTVAGFTGTVWGYLLGKYDC